MTHQLAITPQGRLAVHEHPEETGPVVPRSLLSAFGQSTADGLIASAAIDQTLPVSFAFLRVFARQYFSALAKVVAESPTDAIPAVPVPDLALVAQQAPPMIGLEYLSLDCLDSWWKTLDAHIRGLSAAHAEGFTGWLREHNPAWRSVGRVTFHLAENKRDPERPFAFLATFSDGLTPQGSVRHSRLEAAQQQYSGTKNRSALLNLLMPVATAAESVPWVRECYESGELYQTLHWSPAQAFAFLKSIPQLEAAGLLVRVPDWWNASRPPRPRVNVTVNGGKTTGINVDALLDFQVDLSLEGESLTPGEIDALLASGNGLVSLRGKWVEVDSERLKQAMKHWKSVEKSVQNDGLTFFQGMRLLSGASSIVEDDADAAPDVQEWTGLTAGPNLSRLLDSLRSPEAAKSPPDLNAELRPYQCAGFGWLRFLSRLRLGACLADDMGLGKTIQVIALLLDRRNQSPHSPALLIVPASLIANWKSELKRFAPGLRFVVAHPSEPDAAVLSEKHLASYDVVITTYGMLVRTEWLKTPTWGLIVLDEAQAIRNSGTKQTLAVKSLKSVSRIALTGTPVENRLSDLWSLFDFLNPGLLGAAKPFAKFVKQMQQSDRPSFATLRSLVQPYILRRMKTDKRVIADLPDKTEVDAWCPLSKQQAALYQHAVDDLADQLENSVGIARRGLVLAQLMRLKQICNHPAQATGVQNYLPEQSGKFRRLGEIAAEIHDRQERLLVFSQFREITGPIAEFLATVFHAEGLVLHGGTSVKARKTIVDQFQRDDGPPFLVLSLKAGGTGLNLTAASHVVHFDRWWNPAVENQATDRAFRIGQKRNVLVHKFICRGTLEERIDEMIREKRQLADAIVGSTGAEALLTEMDNATLLKFVRLDLTTATAD
jgi:superfamily II DNA or RNA helicase